MGMIGELLGRWFGAWKPRIVYSEGSVSSRRAAEAYEHDLVRAIVDTIATHVAKSEAVHIRVNGTAKSVIEHSPYARLINEQPNDMMSGFDLKYRMISQLETTTTAMAYIQWEGTRPRAIYPVGWRKFELAQTAGGIWGVVFVGADGKEYKLPLEDVVLLRRHYNQHDVYGGGIDALKGLLSSLDSADAGIRDAMSISNKLRLLYKTKRSALSPKDKTDSTAEFVERMERASANGGVATLDLTEEVAPIDIKAYTLTAAQMEQITERAMSYWRISKAVLTSNYTDNQYQAFYESVVEPLLLQLGQAFTNAMFTRAEIDRGNRIIFVAPMLLHASTATKAQLINTVRELGVFTVNEARELLGYAPIEGGEKRLVSLNYVNADKQDQYQIGDEPQNEAGQEEESGGETA